MNYPFPSYKSPPLNEVSIGLQFQPLERLKVPHFGLFWESIRQSYPVVEHAAPIFAKEPDFTEGYLLPRVWFIDKTDTQLLQVQRDRINFNWRFREGTKPYPRYQTIAPKFFELFKAFEKFLVEANIGLISPTAAEMTYVNLLECGKEWSKAEDLAAIFRDYGWDHDKERFLPHPNNMSWAMSFGLPKNQGTLNVRLSPAKRVSDQQPILKLELVATYLVQNMSFQALEPWYELAHEWIVKGFADLMQPEAQSKFWGREQ